ncbi:MAG: class I SAM-dependent methyltransferase [Alphaproteobacteria bacterium]|nr:class I SAM-dependent methyltransferase [Alphaproteobacteria bacterium]
MPPIDIVKRQVALHWGRRAAHFDEDFGHSIRTPEERNAWDRVFALAIGGRNNLAALDVGCGTGILSLELAARGHRVTGIDFAPEMLALARAKAADSGADIRFEEGDAEQLPFAAACFDLVITRHVLWTLPHPEAALDEWIRVLRPGGRLAVIDGQSLVAPGDEQAASARRSAEYAPIGDRLPFLTGRPQEEIEALFRAHGLAEVGGDPLADVIMAQNRHAAAEGEELRPRRRYIVWGDVPLA